MDKDKDVWKICRVQPQTGRHVSAIMSRECEELSVPYTLGKWTHGIDGTPVTAFDSERHARDFAYYAFHSSQYALFRCEARNPRRLRREHLLSVTRLRAALRYPHYKRPAPSVIKEVKSFWKQRPYKFLASTLGRLVVWDVPTGTVICDAIKPVEVLR